MTSVCIQRWCRKWTRSLQPISEWVSFKYRIIPPWSCQSEYSNWFEYLKLVIKSIWFERICLLAWQKRCRSCLTQWRFRSRTTWRGSRYSRWFDKFTRNEASFCWCIDASCRSWKVRFFDFYYYQCYQEANLERLETLSRKDSECTFRIPFKYDDPFQFHCFNITHSQKFSVLSFMYFVASSS